MGTLVGIYIADGAGAPMRSVAEAQLVSGRGIVGDRYFEGTGRFSPVVQEPAHEITLVEIEQLTQFNAAHGLTFRPEDLRRNLVTSGVRLNALVGVEFVIGRVVLQGIRLCEPCDYLAGLTRYEVLSGLIHRGGLRAGIVTGGPVNLHDPVAVANRHAPPS
ncbi:MAG: MOSC domain-containing protein [Acidobacteriota bacterium]